MDNILGYIADNSVSIIFFIVLILLAIIGYYAEKANNQKNKKDSQDEQLNKVSPEVISQEKHNFIENLELEQKNDLIEQSQQEVEQKSTENIEIVPEDKIEDSIKEQKSNELLPDEIPSVDNIQENTVQLNQIEGTQTNEIIFNKEEINRFNEEFESILPKKEIIDSDLLSDIDDLELGKTQKIDLSVVPDLDNIELPKIKQMDKEEDIWKF